jgi:hypothetical protein
VTVFSGYDLARGWLSVAVASAKDEHRGALHRTVSIEAHSDGVRLVATDSIVLLHTWVPNIEHPLAVAPDLDEAPYVRTVAIDADGRARQFYGYVLSLANRAAREDQEPPEVRLQLGVIDALAAEDRPTFDGMEARYVVLELPDMERLKLPVYDGNYPDWRKVLPTFEPVATSRVALDPTVIGRLAKLGPYHRGQALGWTFGGENRAAAVQVLESHPFVEGLVMPCRWDFERNEPRPDPAPPPDPEDGPDGGDGATFDDDPGLPVDIPAPRYTDAQIAALKLLGRVGRLAEAGATDEQAGTIHHSTAEALVLAGLIRRLAFDERLRPIYVLTDEGRRVQ